MDRARALETSPVCITFDVSHHPTRLHVVEALRGKSGHVTLVRQVIDFFEREKHPLFSGFDDEGRSLETNHHHFPPVRAKLDVLAAEKALRETEEKIRSLQREARQAATLAEQHRIPESPHDLYGVPFDG